MYKGNITETTVMAANTNIPFTTVFNTNGNTAYDSTNNAIKFNNPGYYDVHAEIVVTNVAIGSITAQLYADGVAIPGAIASAMSTATTDLITLPIDDIVRVATNIQSSTKANVSIQTNVACSVTSGLLLAERRK